MLKELFDVLSGNEPMKRATDRFHEMLRLSVEMSRDASESYWGRVLTPEERSALYDKDVRVNKLQRRIRKRVITNLTNPINSDVPYSLLLMSLVKDVERLGDYAKNLLEVPDLCGTSQEGESHALPDDPTVAELKQIATDIVKLAEAMPRVYQEADKERAQEMTLEGRSIAKRCDKLIAKIAKGGYEGGVAVDLTLGVRFYKRINGHVLNVLSSLLMPLHKLDYYDEKAVID